MDFDDIDIEEEQQQQEESNFVLADIFEEEADKVIKEEKTETATTSKTTIDTNALTPVPAAPKVPRRKPKQSNEASVRRLKINDVHVEPAESCTPSKTPVTLDAPTQSPAQQQATSSSSGDGDLKLDHYDVAKRLMSQQRSEQLGDNPLTSNSKIGETAAQVNHFLVHISELRRQTDPAILAQLPYVTTVSGAHIGRSFYFNALITAPHLSRPVSENTELMRRMRDTVKQVRRAYYDAMCRTPRLGEETCANKEGCVALRFCDTYNHPLPNRRPLVAFLFEDEMAMLRVSRATIVPQWKKRACIKCMECTGNRLLTNLRFKNLAMDARPYLIVPFYVEIGPGEWPEEATLGPGRRVFESMLFNMPRYTELGYVVAAKHENGQEVLYYTNPSVPPCPVPREFIQRFTRVGFSGAL
jgi:hypothetical protein